MTDHHMTAHNVFFQIVKRVFKLYLAHLKYIWVFLKVFRQINYQRIAVPLVDI